MKSPIPLRADWAKSFPLPKKVRFPKHPALWNEAGPRKLLTFMGRILIALPALLGLMIIMQSFMASDSPLHHAAKPASFIGPANVSSGTMDSAMPLKATVAGGTATSAISANVGQTGS